MKKVTLQLIALLVLLASGTIAQNLIAVQNGSTPTFFLQVDSAIIHSQNGDTIYIPGGTWSIYQPINKRLHMIGVGHNPDSTNATFPTTLIGNVTLAAGASNGSLTGVFLNGGIGGTNVNSYTVIRCRISFITLYQSNSNFTFIENILEGNIGYGASNGSATNCSFFNNIIAATFWSPTSIPDIINSIFKNNIFLFSTYVIWETTIFSQYSLFENNIFFNTTFGFGRVFNSTARNNLFVESISFPIGTNVGSNNIVGQAQSSIFINQVGNVFSYAHDYHLQPTCPGKNAGRDGTDIGIYGGTFPWKAGSIPFNPHFQIFQIGATTDSTGNLNVNIKVAAQDH